MGEKTRVLAIGLDAAEPSLLLRWAADGTLPVLAGLLERSAHGPIENPPGLYVGAVWPSFWTGLPPTRHGLYAPTQLEPKSYETRSTSPEEARGEALWEAVSAAGQRVCALNVPKSRQPVALNGIHGTDWATHDGDDDPAAYPSSLLPLIQDQFGSRPFKNCNQHRRRPDDFIALREALCDRAERLGALSGQLLDEGGWDLFLTVFGEPHCVGHQCWHLHDSTHEQYDEALANPVGDPVRDVYVAVDGAIGQLLERAGPQTSVLVFSSHGMGPKYAANFYLDRILRQLEGEETSDRTARTALALIRTWHRMPRALRAQLGAVRDHTKARLRNEKRDMSGERYFRVPNNDAIGGVRINLEGREPRGCVKPGAEFEALCAELTSDLEALVHADTGRPAVRAGEPRRQCLPGRGLVGGPRPVRRVEHRGAA